MEEFKICKIKFEEPELNFLIENLNNCFKQSNKNFAQMCFSIYKIWSYCKGDYRKAKDNEYYNSYSLLEKFGFDKKAVSRYKNSYERFCQGDTFGTVIVKDYFNNFSASKLFELLPLSYETLERAIDKGFIRYTMTVKAIRNTVKLLIHGEEPTTVTEVLDNSDNLKEINEEEIPMTYSPDNVYDIDFFKARSKNQLINYIMTLQTAYQKLKNKRK